jgi:hypothetical protein
LLKPFIAVIAAFKAFSHEVPQAAVDDAVKTLPFDPTAKTQYCVDVEPTKMLPLVGFVDVPVPPPLGGKMVAEYEVVETRKAKNPAAITAPRANNPIFSNLLFMFLYW